MYDARFGVGWQLDPHLLWAAPNNVPLWIMSFFKKGYYIKKEHYSNFSTFEIVSLLNVLGHHLRKYGSYWMPCILDLLSLEGEK